VNDLEMAKENTKVLEKCVTAQGIEIEDLKALLEKYKLEVKILNRENRELSKQIRFLKTGA
jgi:predicted RNase H-like nuclease (RuvC/YqgF family)